MWSLKLMPRGSQRKICTVASLYERRSQGTALRKGGAPSPRAHENEWRKCDAQWSRSVVPCAGLSLGILMLPRQKGERRKPFGQERTRHAPKG